MMNKLLGLVVASVLMMGCQSQEEKEKIADNERKSDLIKSCISRLKVVLKDPDSMKVTVTPQILVIDGKEQAFFMYNAKNSYGGYAGNDTFYCKFDSSGSIEEVKPFD